MQMLGSSITKHEKLVVSYSYRAKGKVEFSLRRWINERNTRGTLGSTVHNERHFAVSKKWETAPATEPENPAARLTAKGETGPTSSFTLRATNPLQ